MDAKMENEITHTIFFAANPATLEMPYKQFFEGTCSKVTSDNGQYFYYLDCFEIDTTHPIYLNVLALMPETGGNLRLLIPHSLVMVIWKFQKGERVHGIGFLRS
jgi:hypothetical protein